MLITFLSLLDHFIVSACSGISFMPFIPGAFCCAFCVSLVGDVAAVLDTLMLLTLSPGGDTLQSLLAVLSLLLGSLLSASIALVFVGSALVLPLSPVVFRLFSYLLFAWCIGAL